ncbi:AAA family ATPase [Microbispora sp. ZYX-F-249]|uniref:Nuclease SbcCD subunit C n=1 Tax=Microbispora maris TaxID=3144104 RepID=A0ABV0AX19_9ACTN
MLRLRHLRIQVFTDGPVCGTEISFTDGLNVLRADNSSGKSTCLQAIIYALGLEGMLSAKRDIPLPHAMTDTIEVEGQEYRVRESWVALEIENANAEIMTVRRAVKSADRDSALIETFGGPVLTERMPSTGRDFFVRRPGAAQRESGFHYELARFIGWNLPQVARMDGSEVPLYLECLFPFFFVEQKHGWSGVQARIPTYFMIRDVSRRAAEFILALEEYQAVLQRQRLESAAGIMESEWKQVVSDLTALAKASSVVIRGLPTRPSANISEVAAEAVVHNSGAWLSLEQEIDSLSSAYESLEDEVPSVGEDAPELEIQLTQSQEELTALTALTADALQELGDATGRRDSIELRVSSLEEDLQRHRDAALLRRLGSRHAAVIAGDSVCPTCQQSLPDGFEVTHHPMSPEENIRFIEQELRTFRAIRDDLYRLIDVQETKLDRLRSQSSEIRRRIRALKDSLTSANSQPSVAAITEKLRLSERIETLTKIRDDIADTTAELRSRAAAWATNRESLRALVNRPRSSSDTEKVDFLEASLVDQLRRYHFHSLPPQSIEVSRETYRPTHEGFDLGFDLSASDMIRVIWAYLLAFLEASMRYNTNHARLLVFDEPRQQETNRLSFAALLNRAATDGASGAQIIFATSEEELDLRAMLKGLPHSLVSVPPRTKLIRPV